MRNRHVSVLVVAALLLLAAGVVAAETIPNWPAPAFWTPPNTAGGIGTVHAMGDVTFPMAFVGVTPCRIVDTRNAAGTFGGPKLVAGVGRNFPLPTGPCTGLPAGVKAYSLNITAVSALGSGFILIFPQGGVQPLVSTLNYLAGQTVANAAIVPAGTAGGVTVIAGVSGTDLLIDINGYYAFNVINSGEYFGIVGSSSGGVIYGSNTNTAGGYGGNFLSVGAIDGAGVHGENDATPAAGAKVAGVLGEAAHGDGVYGTNGDGNGAGVHGVLAASVSFSAAVRGQHTATGTEGIGVYGSHAGAGWGVYGVSAGTTGSGARGVYGTASSTTNGTAGVYGLSSGGSGAIYGVFGKSNSTTFGSAAVYGLQGAAFSVDYSQSGVRGESANGYGVLGVSKFNGVQGILADPTTGGYLRSGRLGYSTYGVYSQGDFGGTGAKYFVEPHPTDATKVIKYVALEGPEAGTYFRGKGRIVGGQAVIQVPESFRMVTDSEGLTVQVTPIGRSVAVSVASYDLDVIVVESNRDVEFFYVVQGVRKAFKDFQPITEGSEFQPERADESIPAYLTSEARKRLIANGTYNADGTVNLNTAERLGWAQKWREQEAAAQKAAEQAEAEAAAKQMQASALATQSQQQQ